MFEDSILTRKKVELLAPAGSFDSLRGAVNAGADAVYMGGTLFSARAYAENPDNDGLKKSVEYCHFYGRKLYLAVNTLLKQDEIDNLLYDYLAASYEAGIDGVIVQDLGVMRFINAHFPDIPIHISTQASVMTAGGAEYLRSQIPSVTRVVPARELSLAELKRFRAETDLEMEVFVHGALCVCYSGMCLMSSYIGDRSGNRGRCAQPCRKLYSPLITGNESYATLNRSDRPQNKTTDNIGTGSGSYLLSPKDQCLLDDIPKLIDLGIDSFKIEGRMKSPEYTAGTVAVYRQKIDEAYGENEIYFVGDKTADDGKNVLAELYNRGGFNRGYLFEHNGRDMMSLLRPNHSGTQVGTVEKVNGREAVIRLSEKIYDHDVLEIRRDEQKIFEFTTAQEYTAGSIIKTVTMKNSRPAVSDMVYRTRCNVLLEDIKKACLDNDPKLQVNISFIAHEGSSPVLTISCTANPEICASVNGNPASKAQKSPLTTESVKKQLVKLGDTSFEAAGITIDIDEDIFIPVSQLNEMRREACMRLEKAVIEAGSERKGKIGISTKNTPEKDHEGKNNDEIGERCDRENSISGFSVDENTLTGTGKRVIASCTNIEQIEAAVSAGIEEICFNIDDHDIAEVGKAANIIGDASHLVIGLPYACRTEIFDKTKDLIGALNSRFRGIRFMVRNFDEIALLKEHFPEIISEQRFETDHMPYCMNSGAEIQEASWITLSNEADFNELKKLTEALKTKGARRPLTTLIIYGYQPSMISAQCVYKNITGKCLKNGRQGAENIQDKGITKITSCGSTFVTRQCCGSCTNIIYNSACLNNIDRIDELDELDVDRFRLDFTFETPEEVKKIIDSLKNEVELPDRRYTRGHLYRAVQ